MIILLDPVETVVIATAFGFKIINEGQDYFPLSVK